MSTFQADLLGFGMFATSCALLVWKPQATISQVIQALLSWAIVLLSMMFIAGGLFAYFWDRVASWGLTWSCLALVVALMATLRSWPPPFPEWLRRILQM